MSASKTMSGSQTESPGGRTPRLFARALCCLAALVSLAWSSSVAADGTPETEGQADPVRDKTDTVHLDWEQLRCWNEFDIHPLSPQPFLTPEFKPLWMAALASSDRELRRNAILAIGVAHKGGYLDFTDVAEDLRAILNGDDVRTETRIDAARTLVILDARTAAPDLMNQSGNAPELRQIAERAFADWNDMPARDMWMSRLAEPAGVPHSHLALAIRGLATVGHKAAADPVRKIVLSPGFGSGLRLTAARGLAELQTSGLEETAKQLLSEKPGSLVPALLAATLLQRHSGGAAEELLLQLITHSSSAVVSTAWGRLDALNPDRIPDAVLAGALGSRDARVRLLAVQSCGHRTNPHVEQLAAALDDTHPDVRCLARHALRDQASRSTKQDDADVVKLIEEAALANLFGESWRRIEQACLLAAELDDKLTVIALVDLVQHPRDEVASASAYALKELAVAEMLPKLLEQANRIQSLTASGAYKSKRTELVLPHLFEAFAEYKYKPAENLMKSYIAKTDASLETPQCRSTAIWSLAYLHEGNVDLPLARQFTARMFDRNPLPGEAHEVFAASAMALGIMKADGSLGDLRKLGDEFGSDDRAGRAAYWSINRLTDEPIPPRRRRTVSRGQWFLTPLSRD
jgi:hypothetical protein